MIKMRMAARYSCVMQYRYTANRLLYADMKKPACGFTSGLLGVLTDTGEPSGWVKNVYRPYIFTAHLVDRLV